MRENRKSIIEQLLSSKTRLRILKVLLELKEVNITKLTRMTELNHKIVKYHINILKEYGIVEEKQFGRVKLIRLNESDPKVQLIKEFFQKLELLSQSTQNPEEEIKT